MNEHKSLQEKTSISFKETHKQSNTIIRFALLIYFLLGLALAAVYDTWFIALSIGPLCLLLYYIPVWLLPEKTLHHYTAGLSFSIFMAQFIYQMHGMFEMHFFAFIGVILLITYQNWKIFIPATLFIVIHHAAFAYLQYKGIEEVYFTQLAFMDMNTFIIHVGLAAVIIGLCAFWAYDFGKKSKVMMADKVVIEKQLQQADKNISIAAEIAEGNLELELTEAQASDKLGQALSHMLEKLREADQRERLEKFINQGLASLHDILRKKDTNLKETADTVLQFLVRYVKANQGSLFVHKPQTKTLQLLSCYAYDKKKHLESEVAYGQGLIGQAFLEKETIQLKEVPASYVRITSGLGEATPRFLIIVPLKVNETVVGVFELAFFKVVSDDVVQLLELAAEHIGSEILAGQKAEEMRNLLEQSQEYTEQMRSQEEEMRQNMEELQATQEELARKEREYLTQIEQLKSKVAELKQTV
ncbi:GAF domain-containing protein [Catalinimonas niigatensis]|uniref:GAF domain-containing protein n=1 Tax=Catalinimonas niigatensis TaxID=1397264 RepID=UPI002666781C|nr:GAF domain-containing protein [Catalinimonas niigatensis]WPP48276.1 GAF domain-containing protein [Catalinimonas niigatensis]